MPNARGEIPLPLVRLPVENGGKNSVSGLSSGAFMAVQLHLAWSSLFVGAGIIAGGPYRCAETFRGAAFLASDSCILNALYIAMSPLTGKVAPKFADCVNLARKDAADGLIDGVDRLKPQRVYIFTGQKDTVLSPMTVHATREFYQNLGVDNILFIDNVPAGHSIITTNPEDLNLSANKPPYINFGNGVLDGKMQSWQILKYIYPEFDLEIPKIPPPRGRLYRFDQHDFLEPGDKAGRASLDDYGYVYIPGSVLAGQTAVGVHIAFHGCKQGASFISESYGVSDELNQPRFGNRFMTTTGYNDAADLNKLIILYPQARGVDDEVQNPEGCWDWWGYTQPESSKPDYSTKNAVQIRAIHKMLVHLISGTPGESLEIHPEARATS